jgi:hypothetical protein
MRFALVTLMLFALTGCIPVSLHSICKPDDKTFDPQYVGTWGDGSGYWELLGGGNVTTMQDETGLVISEEHYAYDVYYTEAGKSSELHGQLTQIDGVTFLDLSPLRDFSSRRGNDDIGGKMIELMLSWPMHTWVKIAVKDGKLQLTPVNLDFINGLLEHDPAALPHLYADDTRWPIITASTDELRSFISAHMKDDGFFGEMGDLKHLGPPTRHNVGGIQTGNSSYDSQYRNQTTTTQQTYESKPN